MADIGMAIFDTFTITTIHVGAAVIGITAIIEAMSVGGGWSAVFGISTLLRFTRIPILIFRRPLSMSPRRRANPFGITANHRAAITRTHRFVLKVGAQCQHNRAMRMNVNDETYFFESVLKV